MSIAEEPRPPEGLRMERAETLLERARRHVAEGEQRIKEQQLRIAKLGLHGADTSMAARVLDELINAQRALVRSLQGEESLASRRSPAEPGAGSINP